MVNKDLPRKIPELKMPLTQNEYAIAGQIKVYNGLPVGHPDRRAVHAKIEEMKSYSDWD